MLKAVKRLKEDNIAYISTRTHFCYPVLFFRIFVLQTYRMGTHEDQRYLVALVQNDVKLVDEIYRLFSPAIRRYILQNQGDEMDAADILQESLIDIYHQAKFRGLQLTCPLEPFLLLVARRKWINELKKRGHKPVTKLHDDVYDYGEDAGLLAEQLANQEEKARILARQFARLGEKCREILQRCMSGRRQEDIAAELGVSYAYLRKKKSNCMATLIEYVEESRATANK